MKKIVNLLLSRGILIGLSIVVQVAFWFLVFTVFEHYSVILIGCMTLLSIFCMLYVIIKNIYPEHKIAWIIFFFLFPLMGGIFYLTFGIHRPRKKTQLLHDQIDKELKLSIENIPQPKIPDNIKVHSSRQIDYLQKIAHAPLFENTNVSYFPLGEDMFVSLLEELEKAEKFIFIESFIIEKGNMWDSIEKILIKKAQAGVDVRVLYDDFGCLMTLPSDFCKHLETYGIKCEIFNKFTHLINADFNNRDHRKICVIDGNVGFNGGINLADEYINQVVKFGHWKDTAVMLKGDAVYGLTLMFLSMWSMQTGKIEDYDHYAPTISAQTDGIIQPYAVDPLSGDSVGENVYMSMLNTANDYVYITSPYLIITREMTTALTNAAKSGVDVRLIVPGIPDRKFVQFLNRSYYPSLVEAGVKIYEYTPGFIHAKMFISDDTSAIVGTINLDYRSLDLHYECATMMYGSSITADIKADFLHTQEQCKEITLDLIDFKKHGSFGILKFIALGILRTISPLL